MVYSLQSAVQDLRSHVNLHINDCWFPCWCSTQATNAQIRLVTYMLSAVVPLPAGPFEGIKHGTALLDRSLDRGLRCCLLRLLESCLVPQSDDGVQRVIAANGQAFVQAGGVQLAIDLVTGQ